ncbi:MAG: exo-alpha-sialidase, partial [bacterium]|nr:exo-alpha-sialidase [bacterium]
MNTLPMVSSCVGIVATLVTAAILALWPVTAGAAEEEGGAKTAELVSVTKIWDQGAHNAFTDLIRFQDQWFCSFREGDGHVGGDGALRILVSADGEAWESAGLLTEEGIDLRDPKMSVTADGRLMVVAGGSVYKGGKDLLGRQPRVAFSRDGREWTAPQRVLSEGEWLWRVTWHKGRAYGTSYNIFTRDSEDWSLKLYASDDGVDFEQVSVLKVPDKPNETTIQFMEDDSIVALIRREAGTRFCWIGTCKPPYTDWTFHETKYAIGGPNFIQLPNGEMWAGGRYYPGGAKTTLATFGPETYEPVLMLPSGGDTSYPG